MDPAESVRAALARIEEVARENEVLKQQAAGLRDRVEFLSLGVGHGVLLIHLGAAVREWRDRPCKEAKDRMLQLLNDYDRRAFGPDGPSSLQHARLLQQALPRSEELP